MGQGGTVYPGIELPKMNLISQNITSATQGVSFNYKIVV